MNRIVGGLVVFTLAGLALFGLGPEAGTGRPEVKKMFNDMIDRTKLPAEAHEALGLLVGDFATVSEVHVDPPPAEPMVARAHTTGKWILNGLFVEVNAAADADEAMKGERMLVYGYDPIAKKYTLWQIESGNMTATEARGDYDSAAKTLTFEGERDMGQRGKLALRWTIRAEPDGSLDQKITVRAPGAEQFTEFVHVTHRRK